MTIKEKPLINAVSNPDALPGFLFFHPVFTGFFTIVSAAIFGGVATLFWSLNVKALETFEAVRIGAIVGAAFAGMIFIYIFITAFKDADERSYRLQFVLGGFIGLVMMGILDWQFTDDIRARIQEDGYLICTSQVHGCD